MRVDRITEIINKTFPQASGFELEDLSHQHAGRAGTESHFKLLIVDAVFQGQSRVQRQRKINELLASEFEQGLHALTMRLLTPEEAEKQNVAFTVPNCQGNQN